MKKYNLTKIGGALLMIVTAGVYIACQPEDFYGDNGIKPSPDFGASFTVTPVEGKTNTYTLDAKNEGVTAFYWDKGDGKFIAGSNRETLVLPDADLYSLKLKTVGIGGVTAMTSQDLEVEVSDPVSGNLVQGNKMDDPTKWTLMTINAQGDLTFEVADGELKITGGGWGHEAIYQALEVVAGRKYKLDMYVEGAGASDTWFEAYVGTDAPNGGDYTSGGTRLGLNTWTGCGKTAFGGKLSSIACTGSLIESKTMTFDQSGTVYLVIKCGGGNSGGMIVDNIEFRAVPD